METEILKLIISSSSMALSLAILFVYSWRMFIRSEKETERLKKEFSDLQRQFHTFKDKIIEELLKQKK